MDNDLLLPAYFIISKLPDHLCDLPGRVFQPHHDRDQWSFLVIYTMPAVNYLALFPYIYELNPANYKMYARSMIGIIILKVVPKPGTE